MRCSPFLPAKRSSSVAVNRATFASNQKRGKRFPASTWCCGSRMASGPRSTRAATASMSTASGCRRCPSTTICPSHSGLPPDRNSSSAPPPSRSRRRGSPPRRLPPPRARRDPPPPEPPRRVPDAHPCRRHPPRPRRVPLARCNHRTPSGRPRSSPVPPRRHHPRTRVYRKPSRGRASVPHPGRRPGDRRRPHPARHRRRPMPRRRCRRAGPARCRGPCPAPRAHRRPLHRPDRHTPGRGLDPPRRPLHLPDRSRRHPRCRRPRTMLTRWPG